MKNGYFPKKTCPLMLLSVIIPCRDEVLYIADCLDSLVSCQFQIGKYEIIVVDGMSTDGTKEICKEYEEKYPDIVKVVENPEKNTPLGMNLGIKSASSEFIIILGAHTKYPDDFLEKNVTGLLNSGADAYGGIIHITTDHTSTIAKALALANSHFFSVGNVYYRIGSKELREVDTVAFGCYRKSVFNTIGYFNEKLKRGQDREFNARLRQNGGRIILDPSIESFYSVRSTFFSYMKWIGLSGYWLFYGSRFTSTRMKSWRNYVPLIFFLYNISFFCILFFQPAIAIIISFPLFIYFLMALFFSIKVSIEQRSAVFLPLFLLIFISTHLSYALGSVFGVLKKFIGGLGLSHV